MLWIAAVEWDGVVAGHHRHNARRWRGLRRHVRGQGAAIGVRPFTLLYTFCGVPIGLLTINELSRLLVFIVHTVSFVIVQYEGNGKTWRVSVIVYK